MYMLIKDAIKWEVVSLLNTDGIYRVQNERNKGKYR